MNKKNIDTAKNNESSAENIVISVIIPCYNQEKFVGECLDSVLAQNFENYEVIIVNDGSTDNSLSVIQKYQNKFTHFTLINQPNQGVIAARNNAITKANGVYVFPLDADDKILPDCLNKLYTAMKAGKGDVIYGQTEFFGAKKGLFKLKKPTAFNMTLSNCVVCSALFAKADWLKFGGYDSNMKEGLEDWEFWLNFTQAGKHFFQVNDVVLQYRILDISRTTGLDSKIKKKLKKYIRQKHNKLFKHYRLHHILYKLLTLFYRRKELPNGQTSVKIMGIKFKTKQM